MTEQRSDRTHVVVAGGGVAALEAILALHSLAGHVTELTLVTPEAHFLYRPVTVAEAFDRGEARSYPLTELVADKVGGRIVTASLGEVLADEQVALTETGERIPFDVLVIATGALMIDPLPGALTFRGRESVGLLRALLDDLTSGRAQSVAFVLPSGRQWPLPLYELALLSAAHVRDHGCEETRIHLITPEDQPLELFGPETAQAIAPLLAARGIELRSSSLGAHVEHGELVLAGGGRVHADRVVTMPRAVGPALAGLPHDAHGFIPTDSHGRVIGVPGVFAAGDVTSFPLKQGGLAAQQADAVAETIAADAGVALTPQPFVPVLRGLLLTGGAPLYLRSEPQRLAHPATVAVNAGSRAASTSASAASGQALWWPPAKIAGRYLAPYLATARPDLLRAEELTDRVSIPGAPLSDEERTDAVELALLLAECDAQWGDYGSALEALDAARALEGALPAEYEVKRRAWADAHQFGE